MGKDVLSKIRTNDVYKGLVRVLSDYHIEDYEVRDERPHPKLIVRHVGLEKEFEFPGTPRRRVNVKSYSAKFRRFLQDMQMEALEVENRPMVPSRVGQVHVPMQGNMFERSYDSIAPRDANIGGEIVQTVNARDLYLFLGLSRDFNQWMRDQIVRARLVEGRDFQSYEDVGLGPRARREYALALEAAKHVAMMSGTDRGFDVRDYFIECEKRLKEVQVPAIDLNDPAWLRGQLLSYTEQVIALKETVAIQQPKVEALERIAEADGSLCITDAAKTLQIAPGVLFKWLDRNGWTYTRVGSSERRAYQTKFNAGYLEHKVKTGPRPDGTEWCSTQVRITPKGLAFLAEIFPPIARVA